MKAGEEALQRACTLDGGSAESRRLLGDLLFGTDRIDEAIKLFNEALALDPSLAEAHAGMAAALVDADRVDEAAPGHLDLGDETTRKWDTQLI